MLSDLIARPYNRFSSAVTSHDLIKAIALYIMIVDHVGLFYCDNNHFLRVIGRAGLPVWFFLVGYNFKSSIKIIINLLPLALILECARFIMLDQKIIVLNALFSMMICGLVLEIYQAYLTKYLVCNKWAQANLLFITACITILLYPVTYVHFEYGILGIVLALYGYNCRHIIGDRLLQTIAVAFMAVLTQIMAFNFNTINSIVCTVLLCTTMCVLYRYKVFAVNISNNILTRLINISARYSAYIYVIHLIVFSVKNGY
jgi:hypothetical protein